MREANHQALSCGNRNGTRALRRGRPLHLAESNPHHHPSPPLYALALPESHTGRILAALAPLIRPERPLYCLDGGNCFNPYRLTALLRRNRRDPRRLLDLIYVSRAYTCHQLTTAAETMLLPFADPDATLPPNVYAGGPPPAAEAVFEEGTDSCRARASDGPPRRPPLVLALGIDHMFHDEDIPLWERRHQFDRLLEHLRILAARRVPTVVTFSDVPRNRWAASIGRAAQVLPNPAQVIECLEHRFYLKATTPPSALPDRAALDFQNPNT